MQYLFKVKPTRNIGGKCEILKDENGKHSGGQIENIARKSTKRTPPATTE